MDWRKYVSIKEWSLFDSPPRPQPELVGVAMRAEYVDVWETPDVVLSARKFTPQQKFRVERSFGGTLSYNRQEPKFGIIGVSTEVG